MGSCRAGSLRNRRRSEAFSTFLLGRKFIVITDQQGVALLLDTQPRNRIKNSKLCRWRIGLAEYKFQIQYRPGNLSAVADPFSRIASVSSNNLFLHEQELIAIIHNNMGHPGISCLTHFLEKQFKRPGLRKEV